MSVQNKPLLGEVVASLLDQMEEELIDPETDGDRQHELVMTGGYSHNVWIFLTRK